MRCSGRGLHSAAGTAEDAARFGSASRTRGVNTSGDGPNVEAVADEPEIQAAKDAFSCPPCGLVLLGPVPGFRPSGANGWQDDRGV